MFLGDKDRCPEDILKSFQGFDRSDRLKHIDEAIEVHESRISSNGGGVRGGPLTTLIRTKIACAEMVAEMALARRMVSVTLVSE